MIKVCEKMSVKLLLRIFLVCKMSLANFSIVSGCRVYSGILPYSLAMVLALKLASSSGMSLRLSSSAAYTKSNSPPAIFK